LTLWPTCGALAVSSQRRDILRNPLPSRLRTASRGAAPRGQKHVHPGVLVLTFVLCRGGFVDECQNQKGHQQMPDSSVVLDLTFAFRGAAARLKRMSNPPH